MPSNYSGKTTAKLWVSEVTDHLVLTELPDELSDTDPDYRLFPLSYIQGWPMEWLHNPIVKGILVL